jgi:1,2-phenylacetyl-CoA epoxidase PaaB subunit
LNRREEYYEVFARHEAGDPLHHVGTVKARSVSDAKVFAYTLYDELKWRDMFVVARRELIWIIAPA